MCTRSKLNTNDTYTIYKWKGLSVYYLLCCHVWFSYCTVIYALKLSVQEEYDTYDDEVHFLVHLPFLWTRTKIIEIVAAKDVIFALAQSGLCAAFNRSKSHALRYLVYDFSLFMFLITFLPC